MRLQGESMRQVRVTTFGILVIAIGLAADGKIDYAAFLLPER
jgi:hypothetical protein